MTALIFVYTRTSFKNDGRDPIRQYDPVKRSIWTMMPDALEPGATGVLEPGSYGVISADNVALGLHPTNGEQSGTAFDIVILKGKDPWVQAVDKDTALLGRVRTLIPVEQDAGLDQFMIARGGS